MTNARRTLANYLMAVSRKCDKLTQNRRFSLLLEIFGRTSMYLMESLFGPCSPRKQHVGVRVTRPLIRPIPWPRNLSQGQEVISSNGRLRPIYEQWNIGDAMGIGRGRWLSEYDKWTAPDKRPSLPDDGWPTVPLPNYFILCNQNDNPSAIPAACHG